MSIQKVDVVHLIGGLSAAARDLQNVTNCGDATKELLAAIAKLAKAVSDSPVADTNLSAVKSAQ